MIAASRPESTWKSDGGLISTRSNGRWWSLITNVMVKSTDFRVFGILSPLRADIIAVSGREPVIQYLVIKRVELGLDSLLVVLEFCGLRRYILRIATTGETKNCVGPQSGKAIIEYCSRS